MRNSKKMCALLIVSLMLGFPLFAKLYSSFIASGKVFLHDGTVIKFVGIHDWPSVYWEGEFKLNLGDSDKFKRIDSKEVKEVEFIGGVFTEGNPGTYLIRRGVVKITTKNGDIFKSKLGRRNNGYLAGVSIYLTESDLKVKKYTSITSYKKPSRLKKLNLKKVVFD